MLKIAFITTVDRNPGDAFIRAGIEYLVQQHIPYYLPLYVDKHEYRASGIRKGRLLCDLAGIFDRLLPGASRGGDPLASADIVIQAGTPFYYISPGSDGTYANYTSSVSTDWIQEVWLERLFKQTSPATILNLAVGTCQPYHSDATEFDCSPELVQFIRKTCADAKLTIVREKLASGLLSRYGLQAYCLPCTAIFAPDFHRIYPEPRSFVCMNYMPGGAHYTLGQDIDFDGWEKIFLAVYEDLRKRHSVVVMCHSPGEALKVRALLPEADTFFSTDYADYLRMYAKASFGVLNRVHGAMVMAGMGRPAVVVGNDSRARMAELMGLPTYFVNEVTQARLRDHIADFEARPDEWSDKLMAIKADARKQYLQLLGGALEDVLASVEYGPGYQRSDFDKVKPR